MTNYEDTINAAHQSTSVVMEGLVAKLRAVLCDPAGNVCIEGSDADRAEVQGVLDALETLAQQPAAVNEAAAIHAFEEHNDVVHHLRFQAALDEAVDEEAAFHAFEEHFEASAEDPYFEDLLHTWLTAWRKALAYITKQPDIVSEGGCIARDSYVWCNGDIVATAHGRTLAPYRAARIAECINACAGIADPVTFVRLAKQVGIPSDCKSAVSTNTDTVRPLVEKWCDDL